MRRLIGRVFESQGFRSAGLMTIGNISSTGLSAVAMIIFSRLLGPSDFGVFSVLFSLLLILSKLGDFGVNIAVQREIALNKSNSKLLVKMTQTGAYIKLIISLILALTGIFFSKWLSQNVLKVESSEMVMVVFILSSAVIFYEYINTILQAKGLFIWSVFSNFTQAIGKLFAAVLLSLYTLITVDLVVGLYLFMPLIGGMTGFFALPARLFTPKFDPASFKKIVGIAKWTSIAIVSATLADNLDVIIVQNYLSSYDTGLWSAAVRIASVASLVGWSLGTVLNVRVAAYKDQHNLDQYLKKAVFISISSALLISAVAFFSNFAIKYTVGIEFLPAVTPLFLLLLSTALLTATSPFIALFYLFDKPAYFAISGLISSAILIFSDILLVPSLGVTGAGYARLITRLGVLLFTLYYARRGYLERYAKS